MRLLVGSRTGVLGVPGIFAIVVGAATLIVNADIIFDDALDVPQVEAAILDAGTALRASWPRGHLRLPQSCRRHEITTR